ncbi:MAG: hypothetical protein ACR2OB_03315 [Solirubrobacteraceae bacterium]
MPRGIRGLRVRRIFGSTLPSDGRRTSASRRSSALAAATLMCLALSACGGGSGRAGTLLQQTFTGSHTVDSGNLSFNLTVTPSGSSVLTRPLVLSFGGPFQSLGKGKLPQSDFTIGVNALGRMLAVGIVSTGTRGYITLKGASYQLPAASFKKLESSFSALGASPGGGSASGSLGSLGIHPGSWLVNPSIMGSETVGGADSTHIRAGVNVAALLVDVQTLLRKAASAGVSGAGRIPTSIAPATRARIASEVKNPTVDVWTGSRDKTLRKLAVKLTLAVSGRISGLLGGLRSAAVAMTIEYDGLNQPQTITAPTALQPFSQLAARLRDLEQLLSGR